MKNNISIRIDTDLLDIIDKYAKSRKITRSKAIKIMLKNTEVIQLSEGADIMKELHAIECYLGKSVLSNKEKAEIERCCSNLWLLLNSTIEKIR